MKNRNCRNFVMLFLSSSIGMGYNTEFFEPSLFIKLNFIFYNKCRTLQFIRKNDLMIPKLLLPILLLISFSMKGYTQDSTIYLANFRNYKNYLQHNFEDLDSISFLDKNTYFEGFDFNNAMNCVLALEVFQSMPNDSTVLFSLYQRLKQISQKLNKSGKHIIIVEYGLNSVQQAYKLNEETNKYGIMYVSLGNCCICGSAYLKSGLDKFNDVTFKYVNYVFPQKTKPKKRRFFEF
jgi:hypothetical protein